MRAPEPRLKAPRRVVLALGDARWGRLRRGGFRVRDDVAGDQEGEADDGQQHLPARGAEGGQFVAEQLDPAADHGGDDADDPGDQQRVDQAPLLSVSELTLASAMSHAKAGTPARVTASKARSITSTPAPALTLSTVKIRRQAARPDGRGTGQAWPGHGRQVAPLASSAGYRAGSARPPGGRDDRALAEQPLVDLSKKTRLVKGGAAHHHPVHKRRWPGLVEGGHAAVDHDGQLRPLGFSR